MIHLPNPIFRWRSRLLAAMMAVALPAQAANECIVCHGEPTLTTVRHGKTVSLAVDAQSFEASAHGSLDCVACHEGLDPSSLPHAKNSKPIPCVDCHQSDQVDHYRQSIHATLTNGKAAAGCADCHSHHEVRRLSGLSVAERKTFAEKTCARCHPAEEAQFILSDHGVALAGGVTGAPTCVDCHDEHGIRASSDTAAATNRRNVAAMCLKCHVDKPEVRANVGPSAAFIASYENSVHGRAVHAGNEEAATCVDCHGAHDLRKGSDASSSVSRHNIAETCGNCHGEIADQYRQSIHGTALARGINAAATCTDCHGEHNILSPNDVHSPVYSRNVSVQVCSPCHASVKLNAKFGLANDRLQSFDDSYHGLANKAGAIEVANCASCHGVHDIKPSSDSTSRINKANLARTCGRCHPGANANFARGSVHVVAASGSDRILYLVASMYIVLISVTIGGMVLHNLFDFARKSRHRLAERRGSLPRRPAGHRLYLRMTLSERVQHGLLMLSFFTLVTTGFALRFPDAWWVAPVQSLTPVIFELRGIVHRIAALVLVLTGVYHVSYVSMTLRGKQLLKDLLPVPKDLHDAMGVMLYNIGLRKEKPLLGRFSYVEKAEYWALVWGTILMAVTGTILWFDNTFLGILTKLWWDVARTVHYYEAWLATLAIVVWHLYFVIFNPDTYPINLAFWKGTLTEEEMAEEHPLELADLQANELRVQEAEKEDRSDRT